MRDAYVVFTALYGVVRVDASVGMHILPHLCRLMITDTTEANRTRIIHEINTVLSDVASASASAKSHAMRQGAAQTVFSIIDFLTKWLFDNKPRERNAQASPACMHIELYVLDNYF